MKKIFIAISILVMVGVVANAQTFENKEIGISFNVPAIAINGRTYIPLRAAAESMGAEVIWDNNTSTAYINQ